MWKLYRDHRVLYQAKVKSLGTFLNSKTRCVFQWCIFATSVEKKQKNMMSVRYFYLHVIVTVDVCVYVGW